MDFLFGEPESTSRPFFTLTWYVFVLTAPSFFSLLRNAPERSSARTDRTFFSVNRCDPLFMRRLEIMAVSRMEML
jgi:hypothetical protein